MNQQQGGQDKGRNIGTLIGIGAVVLLLVLFVGQNTKKVEFNLLWFSPNWPLWFIIVVSMILGALLAKLIGWIRARNKK